jgi:malonate-semialdehyde dehydrogenase (acetylating)/methylmalonate-semialdehyde dehydrogenase
MARELTHFIGGAHVAGRSGRFADVHNPNLGQVQARVPLAGVAEVSAAIGNAC